MSQNVTLFQIFGTIWYKATFTSYVWIWLGTTLNSPENASQPPAGLNSDIYRLCGSLHGPNTFWARGEVKIAFIIAQKEIM